MGILDFLRSIGKSASHADIPVAAIPPSTADMSDAQKELLLSSGASINDLQKYLSQQQEVSYDRANLANIYSSMVADAIVSGALGTYADRAVAVSPAKGRALWVTAKDPDVERELNSLLDSLGVEERLYDWAQTIAQYGDLFVRMDGRPGTGLVSIDDTEHPTELLRVDVAGRLIGFCHSPQAFLRKDAVSPVVKTELLPPWQYVHFRNLAAFRRRLPFDQSSSSYSMNFAMGGPTVEGSTTYHSRYGTSMLYDAVLPYKRYRLAMDSLMLMRLSKGQKRLIIKVVVPDKVSNAKLVSTLVDEVKRIFGRKTAMNIDPSNPNFSDKAERPAAMQEIVIPVYGSAQNLEVQELDGSADLKWIVDVQELRNHLVTALKIPLPMLAGYTSDAPSGDWSGKGLENIDIRFAKSVRRLQMSLIKGVTRMCQIHLAWLGKDPNTAAFEVLMNITSSAEERQLQDAASDASDTVSKLMDVISNAVGEDKLDKVGVLGYLNNKFLRLEDLNLRKYILTPPVVTTSKTVEVDFSKTPEAGGGVVDDEGSNGSAEAPPEVKIPLTPDVTPRESRVSLDYFAALPVDLVQKKVQLTEKRGDEDVAVEKDETVKTNVLWEAQFGACQVEIKQS